MNFAIGFYLGLGLRGGASSKNPLAERLGRWLRPKVGPTLCAFGKHETTWYSQGWTGVEGALVRWICARTHHFRHWGHYSDGPHGVPYPAPTWRQQEQWDATGRRMLANQEAAMVAATALDRPGECNDRWATNRCPQSPDHKGPHGMEVRPGVILAPWSNLGDV